MLPSAGKTLTLLLKAAEWGKQQARKETTVHEGGPRLPGMDVDILDWWPNKTSSMSWLDRFQTKGT